MCRCMKFQSDYSLPATLPTVTKWKLDLTKTDD